MRALKATMLIGLLLIGGAVRDAAAESECVADARAQREQCRMECNEDFVIARDICRNIDPECAAGCRVALDACREPVVTELEGCVDQCRVQLDADRAACPRRGRGRDFCIDRAQIRSFLCRDECRENLHVRGRLHECQQAFTTCMTGCGLPPEPTSTPTEHPPMPTPVKTEVPPVPTVTKTEPPPEPTPVPTETPVRTSTPVPTVTLTPMQPR